MTYFSRFFLLRTRYCTDGDQTFGCHFTNKYIKISPALQLAPSYKYKCTTVPEGLRSNRTTYEEIQLLIMFQRLIKIKQTFFRIVIISY